MSVRVVEREEDVPIAAVAAAIGAALGISYVISRAVLEYWLKIRVEYDIEPAIIKPLKIMEVKGKIDVHLEPPEPLKKVLGEVRALIIKGGSIRVNLGGQVLGSGTVGTDGKFSVVGPVVLNPGRVPLRIYINNLSIEFMGTAYTVRDLVIEDTVYIREPEVKIYLQLPPKIYAGKTAWIEGSVFMDGNPPQKYSSYISRGEVTITYDTKKTSTSVDPRTGAFSFPVKFEEVGKHRIVVDVVAFETFAYIGVWTRISIGYTREIEVSAEAPPLTIAKIEPEQPEEHEAITVTVETEPRTHVILEFDDVQVDEAWSDEEGIAVLHVPSSKVKAGTHVVKVRLADKPKISVTKTIEVKEKEEVEIKVELPYASFPYGGVYMANIDTLKAGQYIPHSVEWRLGEVQSGSYTCETGASTLKLIFPRAEYDTLYVLTLSVKVTADNVSKVFQSVIRVGRSTRPKG